MQDNFEYYYFWAMTNIQQYMDQKTVFGRAKIYIRGERERDQMRK